MRVHAFFVLAVFIAFLLYASNRLGYSEGTFDACFPAKKTPVVQRLVL